MRAARATKQRAADPGPQKPSAAPVLAAGRGFVQRLRQVVADGGAPEAGLLRDLGTLRDEISALLEQLATKTRPRGGAGRARRSAQ